MSGEIKLIISIIWGYFLANALMFAVTVAGDKWAEAHPPKPYTVDYAAPGVWTAKQWVETYSKSGSPSDRQ